MVQLLISILCKIGALKKQPHTCGIDTRTESLKMADTQTEDMSVQKLIQLKPYIYICHSCQRYINVLLLLFDIMGCTTELRGGCVCVYMWVGVYVCGCVCMCVYVCLYMCVCMCVWCEYCE